MDEYEAFVEGDFCAETWLSAVLPCGALAPSSLQMLERLGADGIHARVDEDEDDDVWRLTWDEGSLVLVEHRIDPYDVRWHARDFDDDGRAALLESKHAVRLECVLGEPILESYHEALRLLRRLAPEAVAVHDLAATEYRPESWWDDAIEGLAPPPPSSLYTIHIVRDAEEDPALLWFHTHGLYRCGAIELEILDVPEDAAEDMKTFLNIAAQLFIEGGTPEKGEPFAIGQGIELAWLPWEDALSHVGSEGLGRGGDRDEDHDGPRGVLFAPGRKKLGVFGKRWLAPATLGPKLPDHPIFYVSRMETRRMGILATERFPVFRDLVTRFSGTTDWGFLAKIGYLVDGSAGSGEMEHLWFEVHAVDGARLDATLINAPHAIARMKLGDRAWHAADQLSDWRIGSPVGGVGPDRVGLLTDWLAARDE